MPEPRHDVVIAGAGPAGSRVARDLARRGHDVVVLEEHQVVGEPCHCSGFVTPRTLELADVGEDIVCNVIRGAAVHTRDRDPSIVGGNRVHGLVIDRTELDRRLAEQARAAGARVLGATRFVSFDHPERGGASPPGGIRVRAVRDGVNVTFLTRLLIGADGAQSRVARQLGGARAGGMVVGLGALAEYDRNPRGDHVEIFLDPESAPGWFGWTIPLGGGLARLGTGSANGIGPRESFRRLRRRFPESIGAARVHSHSGGLIPLWQPTDMIGDGVMLVGDAARQVKPTSGGGIYAALRAAGQAADAADRALRSGDLSRRSLEAYPRAWHASFGRELRRQHDMHRAFTRLTGRDLLDLLQLLDERSTRRVVEDGADIDFLSHLVTLLSIRKPLLAMKLLHWPRYPLAWLPGA